MDLAINVSDVRREKINVLMYLLCAFFVADWEERWLTSKHKSDYGKFEWTSGKFYGDVDKDKGQSELLKCLLARFLVSLVIDDVVCPCCVTGLISVLHSK